MYELKSIRIANVSPFVEAHIPVTKNDGLVIITGDNRDARDKRNGLNNGSGKSMLFNTIANCRYGAPPTTNIKNSKKDMLHSKDSAIGMKFVTPDGKKVEVVQGPKDWTISENGKDLHVHTNKNQMAKMEELFPITASEFYAYTYVSSLQNSEVHFQNAKPDARLKFITSVFHLDDYDRMKKYFSQQLGLIKEEQIKFDVLEGKLLGVSANLSRIDVGDDTKKVHSKLTARMDNLQRQLHDIGIEHGDLLVKSVELKNKKKALAKLAELKDKIVNFDLKELKRLKQAAEEYGKYVSDLEAFEENHSKLKAKLKELNAVGTVFDIPALEEELVQLEKTIEVLDSDLSAAHRHNKEHDKISNTLQKIKSELKELGFDDIKGIKFTKEDEETLAVCKTTLQLKKLLDSDSGSHCPTCHQDVNLKQIAKSVKSAQEKIKKLRALSAASDLVAKYKEVKAQLSDKLPTSKLESKLAKASSRSKQVRSLINTGHKVNSVMSSLESLRKPKKCEKTEKRPSYYEIQMHLVREHNALKSELGDTSKDIDKQLSKVESKLKDVTSVSKELQSKYAKLSEKKTKIDTMMGEYKILKRQQKEILGELEGVKPLLEKRDMFKALEKAWSSKGMKIDVANNIMSQLEDNLNKYSELLFPEPFLFKAYVNEKGVFCEVHRGKGKPTTDVRLMSGAESDAFKLLFLLSMLLIIEGNRRTNIVVLDEPDSHMDDVFRSLYARRFIPFLREVVPHIFIVTPKEYDIYEDAEVWKVVKKNGVSKLLIGE